MAGPCWSLSRGKPLPHSRGATAIAAEARAQWTERARKRLADKSNLSLDEVDASQLTDEEITPKTWPGQQDASPFYDTLKQIHVAWLLTPRDDLGGACPREIALDSARPTRVGPAGPMRTMVAP